MKKKKFKLKRKVKFIFLLLILVLVGVFCFGYDLYENSKPKKEVSKPVQKEEKYPKEYKASLVMVGDALIHNSVYDDAKTADGYDFKPMLENIKPIIQEYDLAYYNQETILGGTELGLSNYPRFNSPYEVGDAFIDAGFNLVSLANNHTMDRGVEAVENSLTYWKKQENVYTAGSYSSFEERDTAKISEVNGIKYVMLSYTVWTNGLTPPVGEEYYDNVYSDELAKADVERVRDKCDVVMVAMHWGTENSNVVDYQQEAIAEYLSELGVDIIIGAHPHVVQKIGYVNDTLVIYSLGNFLSGQIGTDKRSGLIASVDITKTVNKDKTESIKIDNIKAEFIYTYHDDYSHNFKLYCYKDLNDSILPGYKDYFNTLRETIDNESVKIEELN
ncbi:MAG: CapA family protein [Bacilli bacterium]